MNSGRIRHICFGRNLSSFVEHALDLAGFEGYALERKNACGNAFRSLPRSIIFTVAHSTPRLQDPCAHLFVI